MSPVVDAVFDVAFFVIMLFILCGVFGDVVKSFWRVE